MAQICSTKLLKKSFLLSKFGTWDGIEMCTENYKNYAESTLQYYLFLFVPRKQGITNVCYTMHI
jgi:hypothetical protein